MPPSLTRAVTGTRRARTRMPRLGAGYAHRRRRRRRRRCPLSFRFNRIEYTDSTTHYSAVHVEARHVGGDELHPAGTSATRRSAAALLGRRPLVALGMQQRPPPQDRCKASSVPHAPPSRGRSPPGSARPRDGASAGSLERGRDALRARAVERSCEHGRRDRARARRARGSAQARRRGAVRCARRWRPHPLWRRAGDHRDRVHEERRSECALRDGTCCRSVSRCRTSGSRPPSTRRRAFFWLTLAAFRGCGTARARALHR